MENSKLNLSLGSMRGIRIYNLYTIQSLFSQTPEEIRKRKVIIYNNKEVVFLRRNFENDYYYINILETPEELKGLIIYKNNIILNYPKMHNAFNFLGVKGAESLALPGRGGSQKIDLNTGQLIV